MTEGGTGGEIFIVDDDPAILEMLSLVLTLDGQSVRTFPDGAAFLEAARSSAPACVLLDVRMPGRSGLDILKELNAQHYPAPILMMSGAGDIPMAVDAVRNGALDFIEKPFDGKAMAARIREVVEARARQQELADFPERELLTRRELEVLTQIANGASNKEAGRRLGISPRTIEVHRARIMDKLGARNAADLVRIVLGAKR